MGWFSRCEDVEILRSNEDKIKEQSFYINKYKCPNCHEKPGSFGTQDSIYKYFTCKRCNCDYRVRM